MKNRSRSAMILAIAVFALVLFGLNTATSKTREANAQAELTDKLQTLLPGSSEFTEEPCDSEDPNIRTAYKSANGYVVHVVTAGYAGDISMLVGVSNEGTVTGLVIRDMEETWGLGREALTDWEFLVQFLNTSGDAQVGVDIDALTGATVTSKAVTRGINSAVGFVTGADTSSNATSWGG